MQSSFQLIVFSLFLRDVLGQNGLCDADVTVGSERKVIKKFNQDAFQIYCKFHEGFHSTELKVRGSERVDTTLNFTAEYFSSTSDSLWQSLNVKIHYGYQFSRLAWHWFLTVSFNQKNIVNKHYIGWGRIGEYLKSVEVTAYGQSEWRFTEPGGNCEFPNSSGTPEHHMTESTMWILVIVVGVIVTLATLGIGILVYRIKHPRAAVPPQANREAERQGNFSQTENAIYGYPRQGYVPRY